MVALHEGLEEVRGLMSKPSQEALGLVSKWLQQGHTTRSAQAADIDAFARRVVEAQVVRHEVWKEACTIDMHTADQEHRKELNQAVEAERTACARLASSFYDTSSEGAALLMDEIATAIRARSSQEKL